MSEYQGKYKSIYTPGIEFETDYIVREAARDLMYHNQGPLTEYDLNDLPSADVRPVVLCGDCRWINVTGYPDSDPDMPELRMVHCRILNRDVQACWFCGTGEQKEDADG